MESQFEAQHHLFSLNLCKVATIQTLIFTSVDFIFELIMYLKSDRSN